MGVVVTSLIAGSITGGICFDPAIHFSPFLGLLLGFFVTFLLLGPYAYLYFNSIQYVLTERYVKALETVKWSITSHRGCYGGCSFCSIYFHQGPIIQSRSEKSIIDEITALTKGSGFKGTVTDVGGPTANMYGTGCSGEKRKTTCDRMSCLYPAICNNLQASQKSILKLWDKIEKIKGIKHFFIASGIRFDLALKNELFIKKLVSERTGGHLKVAPEHTCDHVLKAMNKPPSSVFIKFMKIFKKYRSKKQFMVPYMISSHPGCTLKDMKTLNQFMTDNELRLEQAQDFIPLPMTLSAAMFYTGMDPTTKKEIFVEKSVEGKLKQRKVLLPHKRR